MAVKLWNQFLGFLNVYKFGLRFLSASIYTFNNIHFFEQPLSTMGKAVHLSILTKEELWLHSAHSGPPGVDGHGHGEQVQH
jgi:hypothetical protein